MRACLGWCSFGFMTSLRAYGTKKDNFFCGKLECYSVRSRRGLLTEHPEGLLLIEVSLALYC